MVAGNTLGEWHASRSRRSHRRIGFVAAGLVVLAGSALLVGWYFFHRVDWGTPTHRVASPTGEFEVVQYEFDAMIDPGWNLAIERVDSDDREWFWRSVEHRAPATIRFVGPTSIEVLDDGGERYRVDFDPDSLEPSDRYCLSTGYCYSEPWDDYTRDSP